ncbi:ornithine cyclodeaminase [Nitzschia inconspicua]|uniref:Ornithine cyclodeaminase n=1 Tax=Nitzschia inconspicua TaxID=303405 RepID=A0A9K3PIC1_9STRA|nr:ornithine cyclodeaminase [Nitzschia inconspicua]
MFILGESDVRKALDPLQCLKVTKTALISLVDKKAVVPSRLALSYPNNPLETTRILSSASDTKDTAEDWTLIKPAAYYYSNGDHNADTGTDKNEKNRSSNLPNKVTMGLKVVSIRANNPSHGLPLVPATILLVDAPSGTVNAVLAGTYITAMRTSAGPALAVQAFQPNVQHLVVFGAGAQAECHIQLMELALHRRIPKITIVNRTLERAQQLQQKIFEQRSEDGEGILRTVDAVALNDKTALADALSSADVVAATTNTITPLWDDDTNMSLKRGCLITGIGSYTPEMQEIPPFVVDRSVVVIDTPEAVQVGDLKHLRISSISDTSYPIMLAGHAFQDPKAVLQIQEVAQKDYIVYKAVGTAIHDVLQAEAVVARAKELELGLEIDMG